MPPSSSASAGSRRRVRRRLHRRVQRAFDPLMPGVRVVKAHAHGTTSCVPAADVHAGLQGLARAMCHRHHGIGADGVLVHELRDAGATMRLLNADGSVSSCLATACAVWPRWSHERSRCTREPPSQSTPMPGRSRPRCCRTIASAMAFWASMGQPVDLRETSITVAGETVTASVLQNRQPAVRRPRAAATTSASTGSGRRCPPIRCSRPARTSSSRRSTDAIGTHSDLGARCGADELVRQDRQLRRCGCGPWRGGSRPGRDCPRRHPARRVAGRRLPDGVGRGCLRRGMWRRGPWSRSISPS